MADSLDLFCFKHEGTVSIAVSEAVTVTAIAMRETNLTLEDKLVVPCVSRCGFRLGQLQQVAKPGDEELIVSPLRAGDTLQR